MRHIQVRVLANESLGRDFFKLTFDWSSAEPPLPGQFLSIRVSQLAIPLLRRPFAFSHWNGTDRTVSTVIERRGSATDILSRKTVNESLDVIGPLGNGFPLPKANTGPFLVAGGIGLGPMLFLARRLRREGRQPQLVFGCRGRELLPDCADFKELEAAICTDDGSLGFHGTAVKYVRSRTDFAGSPVELYCCGPLPMLASAARLAAERGIRCWVSMEQTMGCGMGACMGCVVKTTREPGYARVCKEGPVFSSTDILWT